METKRPINSRPQSEALFHEKAEANHLWKLCGDLDFDVRKMPELGKLIGSCPLVQCPKGLLNGQCGVTNTGGKYELDPTSGCDWVMIYRKLEKIATPHDWSKQVRPRTLEIEPIDFTEKLNCDLCRFANCGQCQDACSTDLPLSRLILMLNKELAGVFKNEPGMNVNAPIPLRSITDDKLAMAGVELQF